MSVRPAFAMPRAVTARCQLWLGVCLLLAAGGALGANTLDTDLTALETLAVRQPVAATQQLDALLQSNPQPEESEQLHADVVRLVIADAQTRPHDVLALSDRIQERLQRLGDARLLMLAARTRFGAFYELGRNDEGWAALEEELRQARRTEDDDLYAQALVDRADYLIKQSDFEPAAAALADAQLHVHGAQQAAEVAYANGLLARAIGDWALTLGAFDAAHEKFQAVGDRTGVADSLARYGEALQHLGRARDAVEPLTLSYATFGEVDDAVGRAWALRLMAVAHADMDDLLGALRLNAQALDEIGHLNEPVQLAGAQLERAALLVRQRQGAEAMSLLGAAFPAVLDQGDQDQLARYYQTVAAAHALLGQYREAYEELTQYRNADHRQTEQLVAHQLAAQRGRLESERLSHENSLLRQQASSSQQALVAVTRAANLQRIALALGALVGLGAAAAFWHQRRLMRRIAQLAQTDALTGMLNRRHILEVGQRTLQRCSRDGKPCAIVMLDVDRFKQINDRFGHVAGDKALRAVAHTLARCVRPGDLIGRYGGEEFAVILPGADAREAGLVAERVRSAVAQLAPEWAPNAVPLTVSGGIAISSAQFDDLGELVLRADRALYRAKDRGRNRMEYHVATKPGALATG